MGIGKHVRKAFAAGLAACLATSLAPAAALGQGITFADSLGVDGTGAAQMAGEVSVSGGTAASNVFVEVASDDFELTGRSPDFVGEDAAEVLDYYGGRIWAQTQGGTAPVAGVWAVLVDGAPVGEFPSVQQSDGTWGLALSTDGASGSLKVEDEHEYSCSFAGTDAEGRTVSALVTFLAQAASPYGVKTIYKDHDETFDGVQSWTEPSATGIIHKQVQHLAATEARPLDAVYTTLMELAAQHAADRGLDGAYEFAAAWSVAAKFAVEQSDPQPLPYKGALGMVIPIDGGADDAPAVGSTVVVFGFDGSGTKTPFERTVLADEQGNKYVAFDDTTLGAYAVGVHRSGGTTVGPGGEPSDPQVVRVDAQVSGAGFINYEGVRVWPKAGAVRYLFTPVVPGNVLQKVEVWADDAPLAVPVWTTIVGYYDLDLGALADEVAEVRIVATFAPGGSSAGPIDPDEPDKPVDPTDPDSPENPTNKRYALTVQTEGAGEVAVEVNRFDSAAPHRYNEGDAVRLACTPTGASQSVSSAVLTVEGMADSIPLALVDGACSFTAPAADATVRVVFSSDDAPISLPRTVEVIIEGGHGSIDAAFTTQAAAIVQASRASVAAQPALFTLFPESGWKLYTALEGSVEVGAYLTQVSGAYQLSVPYVGRDRTIVVRFAKAEDLPPVVQPGTFVSVDVQTVAVEGLAASSLPGATPAQVSVPKGASYSFYLIPAASGDAQLESVRMKRDAGLTWVDITDKAVWVTWPEGGQAGYWLLTLEGIAADTHVRAAFRPLAAGEPERPACKTRNITINVVGNEYGAVFPNTVGKPPLKVPAGKTITVTVVTKSGYKYEVRKADDVRAASETVAGGDIALVAPLADAADGEDSTSTEVIGGAGDADEDWTFVFGPDSGDPEGPDTPGNPDDPNKPTDPDDPNGPNGPGGSDGPGNSGDNNGGSNGNGNGNGNGNDANIGGTAARFTVTSVVVPDSSGRSHGFISPSAPVTVARGGSVSFAFMREVGYRVQYVEVNGARVSGFTNSGYRLTNVQGDTVVRVAFTAQAETDSMGAVQRTVHRLTSLAQTGDLNAPGVTLLAGVAFAAAGVAVLSATRNRRREGVLPAEPDALDAPDEG